MRQPFLWLVGIVGIITAVTCSIYYARIERFWGITQTDFSVFYDAGHRADRHESLYEYRATRYTTDREYLFKYAPPFGVAMIPLSRLTVQVAIRWWYALTTLALVGAFASVRTLLRGTAAARDLPWAVYGLTLLAILRPYLANLRLGQVDVVLACLILGFLVALTRGRHLIAGGCLGVAILCKLVPGVWLLYLAATRRWRTIGWTLLAITVVLASPILVLGVAGTRAATAEWLAVLRTSSENWEWLVRFKNQSVLSAVLRGLVGSDATAVTPARLAVALGITVVLGLLYGWAVWQAIRRARAAQEPLRTLVAPSLVMVAMVIFSPHAWKATFIHLLLPYAVVSTYVVQCRDRLAGALLAGSLLLVSVTAPDLLFDRLTSQAAHLYSPMTWGALLLAAGVWRVQYGEVRAGR